MNTTPSPAIEAVERLVDDIVSHARNLERLDNPVYRPLSEENYRSYVASQRFIIQGSALLAAKQEELDRMRVEAIEAEKETAALRLYKHNMEARYSMLTASINNSQGVVHGQAAQNVEK